MASAKWVVFDVEADGLTPTKIHCLSFKDYDGNKGTLLDYQDIRDFFQRYTTYVGHNIIRWDIPVLRRLAGVLLPERIVDTLALSWYLEPARKKAGLEYYGEDFGIPKPVVYDWDNQPIEVYVNRCEQDVEINHRLWLEQLEYLNELYGTSDALWRFLKYLQFKLDTARLAEESGWKLDKERCTEAISRLSKERDDKIERLADAMPKVPVTNTYVTPKRLHNSDGQLSAIGLRWQDRLIEAGLPLDYDGTVEVVTGYERGNPASHVQIKDWLYSLGWVPQTIKYQRDKKTGELREIPQVNKEHGAGICESIKKLYELEPNLELLNGLGILSHRISILDGFLRNVDSDGLLRARVAGLTNTLRFKHAELVNLPKPEKEYGSDIRGCLVAPDGDELCGSDMASLEDRIKQHFIFPHDPDYVAQLNSSDYDPHLDIAVLAGMMTQNDSNAYKAGDHSKKGVRSTAKNGNYACQYGAGVPRLVITCGISKEAAGRLHKAYWERNWAIKAVAEEQEVITRRDQMWLFNPISGFYYSLRTEKDIFSTLVQGSASYCFDTWVSHVLRERPQITGQFHDEIILTVKKGHQDEIREFLQGTIEETNEFLELNRELGIDVQFGTSYDQIH